MTTKVSSRVHASVAPTHKSASTKKNATVSKAHSTKQAEAPCCTNGNTAVSKTSTHKPKSVPASEHKAMSSITSSCDCSASTDVMDSVTGSGTVKSKSAAARTETTKAKSAAPTHSVKSKAKSAATSHAAKSKTKSAAPSVTAKSKTKSAAPTVTARSKSAAAVTEGSKVKSAAMTATVKSMSGVSKSKSGSVDGKQKSIAAGTEKAKSVVEQVVKPKPAGCGCNRAAAPAPVRAAAGGCPRVRPCAAAKPKVAHPCPKCERTLQWDGAQGRFIHAVGAAK